MYGLAFTSITQVTPPSPTPRWEGFWAIINGSVPFGVRRKPSDMSTFVETIAGTVSGKRKRSSLFSERGIVSEQNGSLSALEVFHHRSVKTFD
jgi:hypothetical protein